MFALVRIHVPVTVQDKKTGTVSANINNVWDHVVAEGKSWNSDNVKLLYLTHRHLQEDTSLIVEAKDQDELVDFLLEHFATMKNVRGIWVLPMAKMRFFEVPRGPTHGFNRFTISINALPECLSQIYERISSLRSGRDVVVNYIALTFQSFKTSLIVCILARSRNHAEYFVDHYIRPLEGILETETTYISKWMRLVTLEDWRSYVGSYIAPVGCEPIEDIDAEDDSLMSGC